MLLSEEIYLLLIYLGYPLKQFIWLLKYIRTGNVLSHMPCLKVEHLGQP